MAPAMMNSANRPSPRAVDRRTRNGSDDPAQTNSLNGAQTRAALLYLAADLQLLAHQLSPRKNQEMTAISLLIQSLAIQEE